MCWNATITLVDKSKSEQTEDETPWLTWLIWEAQKKEIWSPPSKFFSGLPGHLCLEMPPQTPLFFLRWDKQEKPNWRCPQERACIWAHHSIFRIQLLLGRGTGLVEVREKERLAAEAPRGGFCHWWTSDPWLMAVYWGAFPQDNHTVVLPRSWAFY